MWVLLVSDNDIWDKLFAYLYDNFLFVADVIWNTKLPLTDISIGYWLIFWLIIKLSIYSVNGAASGFNDLAPELETASTKVYKSVALGTSKKRRVARFNNKENYRRMKQIKYDRRHRVANDRGKFKKVRGG